MKCKTERNRCTHINLIKLPNSAKPKEKGTKGEKMYMHFFFFLSPRQKGGKIFVLKIESSAIIISP